MCYNKKANAEFWRINPHLPLLGLSIIKRCGGEKDGQRIKTRDYQF